jgi:hypothetical protein
MRIVVARSNLASVRQIWAFTGFHPMRAILTRAKLDSGNAPVYLYFVLWRNKEINHA